MQAGQYCPRWLCDYRLFRHLVNVFAIYDLTFCTLNQYRPHPFLIDVLL